MASPEILLGFVIATMIFGFMPGPALVYTAAQTMAFGRQGGFKAALGLHAGGYVHVFAAALGLAVILELVPTLFIVIKLFGAAYLVWLGIAMIRAGATPADLPEIQKRSARRAFLNSMLVEILNPKTALFFLAFLPQFVDPAGALPAWAQLLILGTAVNLTFSSADIVAVFMTDQILNRMRQSSTLQKWMKWVGGSILVGLGINLAASRA
ncbi:MAG: LysE family translocator [Alphaproteobacteria bacterium]|nr:LysE family translocator [Alphaproteobacteria bacterium]